MATAEHYGLDNVKPLPLPIFLFLDNKKGAPQNAPTVTFKSISLYSLYFRLNFRNRIYEVEENLAYLYCFSLLYLFCGLLDSLSDRIRDRIVIKKHPRRIRGYTEICSI